MAKQILISLTEKVGKPCLEIKTNLDPVEFMRIMWAVLTQALNGNFPAKNLVSAPANFDPLKEENHGG